MEGVVKSNIRLETPVKEYRFHIIQEIHEVYLLEVPVSLYNNNHRLLHTLLCLITIKKSI